jgi:hypothetical protein
MVVTHVSKTLAEGGCHGYQGLKTRHNHFATVVGCWCIS